jgi:hypothetical protein
LRNTWLGIPPRTNELRAVSAAALRGIAGALAGVLVLLAGCHSLPPRGPQHAGAQQVDYVAARWSDLPGWQADSLLQAWPAVLSSCRVHTRADWNEVCAAAAQQAPASDGEIRDFLGSHFQPLRIIRTGPGVNGAQTTGLLTGYFEPQLRGSRVPRTGFATPLYSPPDDLLTVDLSAIIPELKGRRVRGRLVGKSVVPYFTRAQLAQDPALQGHEIVWLQNAPGLRRPEWPAISLDRSLSRRSAATDRGTGQHAGHQSVAERASRPGAGGTGFKSQRSLFSGVATGRSGAGTAGCTGRAADGRSLDCR